MAKSIRFRAYIRQLFMRFILGFILLMLLSLVVFGFVYYEIYVVRDTSRANTALGAVFEQEWQRYDTGVHDLAHSDVVRAAIQGERLAEAHRLLYAFSFAGPLHADFALLDRDGRVIASNLYAVNRELFEMHEGVRSDLARLRLSPEETVSSVLPLPLSYDQASSYAFSAIVPDGSGSVDGYLIFTIKTEGLRSLAAQGGVDQVVVTDGFDNVIFSTNRLLEDALGKSAVQVQGAEFIRVNGRSYYAVAHPYADARVHVVTMTSIVRQQQLIETGAVFLCGVIVLLLLAMPLLTHKVTERSLRSIDSLLHAVRECRGGNITQQELPRSFLEFETLYEDFNTMLREIRRLLATNAELAERKRLMEVRQLKGQFNPHFAFNVMEALRYEILIDPQRASEMVVAFANLMRYSIRADGTSVELGVDIRYVQDYLMLQKMRYGDRLDYTIEIAPALLTCRVPKLLVQPIVENSIVHGLERIRSLHLRIEGQCADGGLRLSVEDDGPGMTDAKYAEILALLAAESAEPEHIGLYNVHRALRLLYGEAYGVEIVRRTHGVTVILDLPLIWEGEDV